VRIVGKLIFAGLFIMLLAGTSSSQTSPNTADTSQFVGSVEGNVYTNKYLEFRVNVPDQWQPVDAEDTRKAESLAREMVKQLNEAKKTNYVPPKFNSITLLYLKKKKFGEKDNSLFRILTTKQPNSDVTPRMVAAASRLAVVASPVAANVSEIRDITIGGRAFATLDYEVRSNPQIILYNRHFVTVHRGYSIGFTISFHSEEEGKYLEGLIKSVTFNNAH